MNDEQKTCLWLSIAVIVLMAIFPPVGKRIGFFFAAKAEEIEYAQLLIQCSLIAAITGGLIYTFKDTKDEKSNQRK